ncbi:MAG: zinc metalloprotease [Nitrososphaeraceae archaeon]|nr:zinc metalloprotease [Nitrososphaeraceae archaeon]
MASKDSDAPSSREVKEMRRKVREGPKCGTPVPNKWMRQVTKKARDAQDKTLLKNNRIVSATIKVKFIHITDGTDGKITQDMRQKQIKELNDSFGSHNIKFSYNEEQVVEKKNANWFNMGYGSAAERQAKRKLHADPKKYLNFYTANLEDDLLGWATFPWELGGHPDMDGVVILYSTLPGGGAAPYDEGATGTHEIGHWLGLYHTFQDGCPPSEGDEVADTQPHRAPDYDCDSNTACGSGSSPVENFMNYTEDACMTKFTKGQAVRAKEMITIYRNQLFRSK